PRPAPGAQPAPPPAPAPAADPIPPVAQAPGDIAPNAPTLLGPASEIRRGLGLQAFIDGQYVLPKFTQTADRGFTVNDAAIYLAKDFGGGVAAMIDLPFASDNTTDNNVEFGTQKAQAFLQWNHGVLSTKFGQFDTIYGVEQNDSKDRFFADAGLVKTTQIPLTHTGALVGVGFEHFVIRGLIADVNNTSSQSTAAANNGNLEFGLQGRFDFAPMYVAVGALFGEDHNIQEERTNLLVDVMGGFKIDRFRLDAYVNSLSTAGVEDASTTVGVLSTFELTPALGLGARLEWLKDSQANFLGLGGQYDALALTVGPSWKVLPEVTLRGDANFANVEASAGGDDESLLSLGASVVAGF
ncbi:MAG: hypothetical protein EOP05_18115, partial [Proteobacteria bacterium]